MDHDVQVIGTFGILIGRTVVASNVGTRRRRGGRRGSEFMSDGVNIREPKAVFCLIAARQKHGQRKTKREHLYRARRTEVHMVRRMENKGTGRFAE